jgi:hypothetical protein
VRAEQPPDRIAGGSADQIVQGDIHRRDGLGRCAAIAAAGDRGPDPLGIQGPVQQARPAALADFSCDQVDARTAP